MSGTVPDAEISAINETDKILAYMQLIILVEWVGERDRQINEYINC